MTQPELYRIADFLKIYPVSRSALYREVKAGRLKITKVGRRSYIARQDAQSWNASLRKV